MLCQIGLSQLPVPALTEGRSVYSVEDVSKKNWGFHGIKYAITNNLEGLINTGQMMVSLIALARNEGVEIFNGMTIDSLESTPTGVKCVTGEDQFFASKVIICTNGMARQLIPDLDVKPARNQVIVTSEIKDLQMNGAFHMNRGYVYFRHIGKRVLIGGFRNMDMEGESTWEFGQTELIQNYLEDCLRTTTSSG